MGLGHKALHAMLANPRLAPFELVEGGHGLQDWILIDHMMVIYKVKISDYVRGDYHLSVANMARTLAFIYSQEAAGACFIALVKDGARAPKPAVREIRNSQTLCPHVEFCRWNLAAIEFATMAILADWGMRDKIFLVTGSDQAPGRDEDDERARGAGCEAEETQAPRSKSGYCDVAGPHVISYHAECAELKDDRAFAEAAAEHEGRGAALGTPPFWYTRSSIQRPSGCRCPFVVTFGETFSAGASTLRDACAGHSLTEADTLLIALANALPGRVTVCTGDSDLIAVLTACGRRGITLRLDNRSYSVERDAHASLPFYELVLGAEDDRAPDSSPRGEELDTLQGSFEMLADVAAEQIHLIPRFRYRHRAFDSTLDECFVGDLNKDVFRYLYRGGVRGPVYRMFLTLFFKARGPRRLAGLKRAVKNKLRGPNAFRQVLQTLCPDKAVRAMLSLRRVSAAYAKGSVPRGTYGRFLKLARTGRYFYMRMKPDVFDDETRKCEMLFFMALCGTDYNFIPKGLGVKGLLRAALTNRGAFRSWCRDVESALWGQGREGARDSEYHILGIRLANAARVPAKTRAKHWTVKHCALMCKTMKYVFDLWNLRSPTPGPEYGLSVHLDRVRFHDI